jgi:hypothetical protein
MDQPPEGHALTDHQNAAGRDHRLVRPVEFDGSLEVSANDPSLRSHTLALGRPHQRWN